MALTDHSRFDQSFFDNLLVAIQNSMEGIALLNAEGYYTYLNPKHVAMFGYEKEEELIGRSWKEIYEQDEINRIEQQLFPLLGANGFWSGETRGISKQGKEVNQHISLTALPDGGLICIAHDITKEKKQESELKLMAQVLETTNNMVLITNENREIEWVNQAFLNLTEYTFEEVIGQKPGKLLQGKNTSPETVAFMKEKFANNEPFETETLNYSKSGKPYWIHIKCQPIFDENKKAVKYFAIEENITERKLAEEQLQESERKLKMVIDASGAGTWEWDVAVDHIEVSDNMVGILGFETKEEVPDSFQKWIPNTHTEDSSKLIEEVTRFINGETPLLESIYRFVRKNGESIWVSIHGVAIKKDENGKPLLVVGSFFDITHRKVAEIKIMETEQRLQAAIEGIEAGVYEWDLDKHHYYYSDTTYKIFNVSKETLPANWRPYEALTHPDDVERITTAVKQLCETGEKISISYRLQKGNGQYIWIEDHAIPVAFHADGTPSRIVGSFLDITHEKENEERIRQALTAAEESAKAKQRFLANITHELRTPMQAIIGIGEQLTKRVQPGERKLVDVLNDSSQFLLGIINDLLEMTKIDEGKLKLELHSFHLSETIRTIYSVMSQKAEEKRLYFQLSIDEKINNHRYFKGDELRVKQILVNIIGNALKFTNTGGIKISVCIVEEKDNDVVIEIKCDDTGIGINPDMLQKVYDEFTQEDESFARRYGGSGLGLSITRKLTELMGGTIHIESEKDKGTHVTIRLPMSRELVTYTNHAAPTEAEALSLLHNKRFLLVDDNKFNRLVISIILDKYHLQYDEAENGNEALDKLKANKYDLVLMDIQMPEKDGLEATREMREDLKLKTPVLIMTAQGFSEDIENMKRRGVNDVIFKPFKEQAFLEKVMHQLSEHQ